MRGAHVEERERGGVIYKVADLDTAGSGFFWSDPDPVRVLKFGPMEIRAKHQCLKLIFPCSIY